MRARRASVADVIPFSWVDGPGNRFAIFFQGCNFDCLACHNPQTIPLASSHSSGMTVDDLLGRLRPAAPYVSGITVSGGEATVQSEFLVELFGAVKGSEAFATLTTFIDSNGNATPTTWETLAPVTDGVMVDLKALDPDRHVELTGHSNEAVLASIRLLHEMGLLYEVRLLPVPGQTDAERDLVAVADWLTALDPGIRVRVNQFATHGVRATARQWAAATPEDLARYRSTLLSNGLVTVV